MIAEGTGKLLGVIGFTFNSFFENSIHESIVCESYPLHCPPSSDSHSHSLIPSSKLSYFQVFVCMYVCDPLRLIRAPCMSVVRALFTGAWAVKSGHSTEENDLPLSSSH